MPPKWILILTLCALSPHSSQKFFTFDCCLPTSFPASLFWLLPNPDLTSDSQVAPLPGDPGNSPDCHLWPLKSMACSAVLFAGKFMCKLYAWRAESCLRRVAPPHFLGKVVAISIISICCSAPTPLRSTLRHYFPIFMAFKFKWGTWDKRMLHRLVSGVTAWAPFSQKTSSPEPDQTEKKEDIYRLQQCQYN